MGWDVISRSDWLLRNLVGRQPCQREPLVIEELNFYPVGSDRRAKVYRRRQRVTDLFWFGRPKGRLLRETGLACPCSQPGHANQGGTQKQRANRTDKHSIIETLLTHIYAQFQIATLALQPSALQPSGHCDGLVLL
jgi:hypothetical protein